jgi:CRP-like cAMP-binding protein
MIESNFLKEDRQNIDKLCTIPTLKHLGEKEIITLLRLSKIRRYSDGEYILREGELDSWLYFLLFGRICIKKADITLYFVETPGEVFGEMRMIDGKMRSASAQAVGSSVCLGIDLEARYRLKSVKEEDRLKQILTRIIAKDVCRRLRVANDELVRHKQELVSLKVQLGLTA